MGTGGPSRPMECRVLPGCSCRATGRADRDHCTGRTMNRDIHRILMQLFPAARAARLGDHDDLLESGILDSVGILDLVAHLETTFGIAVTDDDLVPENFRSVASLAAFVQAKRAPVAGASF